MADEVSILGISVDRLVKGKPIASDRSTDHLTVIDSIAPDVVSTVVPKEVEEVSTIFDYLPEFISLYYANELKNLSDEKTEILFIVIGTGNKIICQKNLSSIPVPGFATNNGLNPEPVPVTKHSEFKSLDSPDFSLAKEETHSYAKTLEKFWNENFVTFVYPDVGDENTVEDDDILEAASRLAKEVLLDIESVLSSRVSLFNKIRTDFLKNLLENVDDYFDFSKYNDKRIIFVKRDFHLFSKSYLNELADKLSAKYSIEVNSLNQLELDLMTSVAQFPNLETDPAKALLTAISNKYDEIMSLAEIDKRVKLVQSNSSLDDDSVSFIIDNTKNTLVIDYEKGSEAGVAVVLAATFRDGTTVTKGRVFRDSIVFSDILHSTFFSPTLNDEMESITVTYTYLSTIVHGTGNDDIMDNWSHTAIVTRTDTLGSVKTIAIDEKANIVLAPYRLIRVNESTIINFLRNHNFLSSDYVRV